MLGLGLGSHKASALRSLAAKLLAKLRERSTYYENNQGSKDTIQEIDNYELLDKASILLTPTAYSDARVHCVKPSLPDYGKNLIPNSGEADSWTIVNSSGTIVNENGYLKLTDTSGAYGYTHIPITVETGKDYIITYNLVDSGTSSSNYIRIGNSINTTNYHSEANFTSTGKRTIRISPSETTIYITLISGIGIGNYAYWNDITVQATADFDFDRASSATRINSDGLVQDMQSITDPELVLNGDFEELGDELVTSTSSTDNWINARSNSVLSVVGDTVRATTGTDDTFGISTAITTVIGKTYKINSFGARNNSSGSLIMRVSNTANLSPAIYQDVTTDDLTLTTSAYFVATATTTYIGFLVTIPVPTGEDYVETNLLSVQQVDPNDRWSLQGESYIDSGKGVIYSTGDFSALRQTILTSGRTYRLNFDIVDSTQGSIKIGYTSGGGEIEASLSGVGSYEYNFEANGTLLDIARFSGATDISIDNVSIKDITFSEDVDLARINYDSNGENGHWLLEPTSTNLVTYSEDFSQWTLGINSTLTYESDVVAPDGSLGVYRLTNPATFNTYIQSPLFTYNNPVTLSIYAKYADASNNEFDLYDGTNTTRKITTSEWQRFDAVGFGNQLTIVNSGDTYITDIYIWGGQAEALSYATSYIPTHGSTVTRATETLTGSGNSTLINSTQGVLYAEIATLSEEDKAVGSQISISDGTTDKRIVIFSSAASGSEGDIKVAIVKSSTEFEERVALDNSSGTDLASFNKIAIGYMSGKNVLFVNGREVTEANTNFEQFTFDFSSALNTLDFSDGSGSNNFRGKVKAIAVFDRILKQEALINLTS